MVKCLVTAPYVSCQQLDFTLNDGYNILFAVPLDLLNHNHEIELQDRNDNNRWNYYVS